MAIPISSSLPVITSPPVSEAPEDPSIPSPDHDVREDITVSVQNILEGTIQPSLGDLFRDRSTSPPLRRHHESSQKHEEIPKEMKEIENSVRLQHNLLLCNTDAYS